MQLRKLAHTSQVISKYVSKGTLDRLCWKPEGARDGPFAYDAVYIVSGSQHPSGGIPFIQPFDVVFEYVVSGSLPPNRISLALSNEAGEVVFGSAETDNLAALNHPWTLGRSRTCCTIPSHLLAPGRYFITISEPTMDGASRIHENVLAVTITPEGCASQRDGRRGLITPLLHWETQARIHEEAI